jgi:ribose-phosphate pyrophosphokinase
VIIVPGPASRELGKRIARQLGVRTVDVFVKRFPDGEYYIRFETKDFRSEEVVIVQTTAPPQHDSLIQLFLMVDAVEDFGAKSVTAVIPYFAYARQDKRFLNGEVFSVKTVVKLLENCGVNRIVTVNAHNPKVLETFNIPVEDLSAIPLLAQYFKKEGLVKDAFSLSMGKKALTMASEADNVLEGGFDYVPTQRDRITGKVTLEERKLPVENRDVIIFDDIISSGGTMAKTVKMVKEQGAKKVYAACVHPLLVGNAEKKILENGAEAIVGTDCVPSKVSVVSVAPIIAEALRRGE